MIYDLLLRILGSTELHAHMIQSYQYILGYHLYTKLISIPLETPATVQHLYKMLNDYDQQVVEEAVQLRRFITNKLIEDTGHTDARHRLKALELLGKISDVGLFSEKTEVIVKHASLEDLETQIKNKLAKLITKGKTIEASIHDIEGEMGTFDSEESEE
jgi:hypothetical protein